MGSYAQPTLADVESNATSVFKGKIAPAGFIFFVVKLKYAGRLWAIHQLVKRGNANKEQQDLFFNAMKAKLIEDVLKQNKKK